jgi:dTDP-4-dehydrorhamnose reductase
MDNPLNIVLLGTTGQVGIAMLEALNHTNHKVHSFDRNQLDYTKIEDFDLLMPLDFDVLINTVAYTAVDAAEENQELAFNINAVAVKKIAEICNQKSALLIHFSTDYVYHSIEDRPLLENDPTLPKGEYAASKLEGEKYIQSSGCRYLILRTSWVFSHIGLNFVKTILRLAQSKDELNIVNDQSGSPTYAPDLAQAVLQIIKSPKIYSPDYQKVFNISNENYTTWYDFALKIVENSKIKIAISPISYVDYVVKTPRPINSRLNCNALQNEFNIRLQPWEDALRICIEKIKSNTTSIES